MIDIERNVKYNEYLKNKIPKTKPWPTLFHAFWVGGIICLLGELCKDGLMTAFPIDHFDCGCIYSYWSWCL